MSAVLLDTGPLFAYLSDADENHVWAVRQFAATEGPLLTCEPVLTEAMFLISHRGGDSEGLWSFLRRGMIKVVFELEAEFESVAALMRRYSNVPMDLADGCIVRMT